MGTINYIAYVIFAVLFLSITIAMYAQYQQGAAEQEFRSKAEELSERIKALGNQSPGTVDYFDISVPNNCRLSFSDNKVIIEIGSWDNYFRVYIPVSGENFSNRKLSLMLERTDNGVTLSAA